MTDEEKMEYIFSLFYSFFPIYKVIVKGNFMELSLKQLNDFFVVITLAEEDVKCIQDVCFFLEQQPEETGKKKFYYCLAKIMLLIDTLHMPKYKVIFEQILTHFDVLNQLIQEHKGNDLSSFNQLYSRVAAVSNGFDLKQTCDKFERLTEYFKRLCPNECLKVEEELDNLIIEKNNTQSCSMAARLI